MTTKEYQATLLSLLQNKFGSVVENEWKAFKRVAYQYSPKVDIAIGPFNDIEDEERSTRLKHGYNDLVQNRLYKPFLKKAFELHQSNLDLSLYSSVVPPSFLEV